MKVKLSLKDLKSFAKKNSPVIYFGVGVAAFCGTVYSAINATPKALELIKEEEDRLKEKTGVSVEITTFDKIRVGWKPYIGTVILGTCSIVLMSKGFSLNCKRTASVEAAYELAKNTLNDYKNAVVDVIGEKKEKEVQERLVDNQLSNAPVNQVNIVDTGKGSTLCYFATFGGYFYSDRQKIGDAFNRINSSIRLDGYASLNELFSKLGLERTDYGEEIGWNIDREGYIEAEFTSKLVNGDTPCLVLRIPSDNYPSTEYYKFDY